MSRFKEIAKKAAITVGLVAGAFAFSMVGNTAINVTKANDAAKFFLESKNDINKATQLYQDKWGDSLLSSVNNKVNEIVGKSFGAKDFEADFGKQELSNKASSMDWIKNQIQETNKNDVVKVAQADTVQAPVRRNK